MEIACDLDGTLAYYENGSWHAPIGQPIAPMVDRILNHLKNGDKVTIFTARASDPEQIKQIKFWCKKHLGQALDVTNIKEPKFGIFYDDRAIGIVKNSGFRADGRHDEINFDRFL